MTRRTSCSSWASSSRWTPYSRRGRAQLQRCLFSATMLPVVEDLATVRHPIKIVVGAKNAAAETVSQRLLFCGREEGKLLALRASSRRATPPVLIFVQSKERAMQLFPSPLYLHCISTISPLHLHYLSNISPLYLHYISTISPLSPRSARAALPRARLHSLNVDVMHAELTAAGGPSLTPTLT